MAKRVSMLLAVLASVGLLQFAGCTNKTTPNAQASASAASATVVETVPVKREDLRRVSEATPAELMAYEKTVLYGNLTGFVKEIRVDYGDTVGPDKLLAVISAPEMDQSLEQKKAVIERTKAGIEQAKAAEKAAEARVETTKAAYERWQSEYQRDDKLVRDKVIDEQAADEALNQLKAAAAAHKESAAKRDLANADVRVMQAQLEVAEAEKREVEALLQYSEIKAPYRGVITERFLHTGAFINTKTGDHPLLTVMRTDKLRVIVEVPEKDVRFLKTGGAIEVDLDAFPGKKFTWPISRLAPVLGAGKKARVEAEIQNPDNTFYPGMYGHATVVLENKPNALTIPATCLVSDPKRSFVWLVADGKAHRQSVATGLNDGKKIEIVSGLQGTEEVICSGKDALGEGQAVLAQKAAAGK